MAISSGPGRPATFERDEVIDRSVEILWRHGLTGATTRVFERELGLSQSSLYNAFGSKANLVDLAVDQYTTLLETQVVERLDPGDRDALIDFVGAVARWVARPRHPGCLILNLATESADQRHRLTRYRARLRLAIGPAIASFTDDPDLVEHRTELVVTAVIGLGLAARTGADPTEIEQIRLAVERQIIDW